MALLIGDIGGTTSRWAFAASSGRTIILSGLPGYNPAMGTPAAMQAGLRNEALSKTAEDAKDLNVIAYGAGCGVKARADRMHAAISAIWPNASIEVNSDLLGAARALYGNDPGLVLILGTGMNAGYYDRAHLHLPMPSLGYVLGDEGSGADIGKHLLHDALYGLVPAAVSASIFPAGPDLPGLLEQVHHGPAPQAFLASFTASLAGHLSDTYVHDLIASRFFALARLLAYFFSREEYREVRAIGSVAFGFQGLLKEVLEQRGMRLTSTMQDPLAQLVKYHAGEEC